jgi:hypothetical protein
VKQEPSQFDDPSLKAAIRELRGGHRASEQLRGRVADALRNQAIAEPTVPSQTIARRIPPRRLIMAAAAAILIAISGTSLFLQYRGSVAGKQSYSSGYLSKNDVLEGMVVAHKIGSSITASESALSSSLSDPKSVAAEAKKKLSRTIPVADLAAAGWKLDEAAFCTIANFQSLRMHFVRDGRSVTVVSLPASAWIGGHDGDRYAMVTDNDPIAGFVRADSLTCVVGDPSVTSAEVIHLRDLLASSSGQ